MELSNNFYPLLLIVVLAFLVPLLLSRFRSVPERLHAHRLPGRPGIPDVPGWDGN